MLNDDPVGMILADQLMQIGFIERLVVAGLDHMNRVIGAGSPLTLTMPASHWTMRIVPAVFPCATAH